MKHTGLIIVGIIVLVIAVIVVYAIKETEKNVTNSINGFENSLNPDNWKMPSWF